MAVEPSYPEDRKYTEEHEWVQQRGSDSSLRVRVGITDYAQDALGDIVYIDLPAVGDQVSAGDPCGELESTKSVSELYAPVTGSVVARNEELADAPEMVNTDPYGEGWLIDIEPDDPDALEGLLEVAQYRQQVEES